VEWVTQRGLQHGYVFVTRRSKARHDMCVRVDIACTLGGKHKSVATKRRTGSQKTNCPFLLVGRYSADSDCWKIRVRDESHNHGPATDMSQHAFARRQTPEQFNTVATLHEQGLGPKRIFSSVKELFPASFSIKKDIYNAKDKIVEGKRVGDTPMQVLINSFV
jgi:hypothetical protein